MKELSGTIRKQLRSIIDTVPIKKRELGGTIFLGSNFASQDKPRILHLGLNPGGPSDDTFYDDLWQDNDPLLKCSDDEENPPPRYWKNARKVYNYNENLADVM